jgi:predicted nuclease of predicted toxin-antitoxin system
VRLLIDNALSPLVADGLSHAGHDVVHVLERGMHAADDEEIFSVADREDRILVSADTDFGTILALRQSSRPSVILFRHGAARRPQSQLRILIEHLDEWESSLASGALITIEESRVRIRALPILRRS